MGYVAAYGVLVGVMSLASVCVYRVDKRRAGTGRRRIPERTLHGLAFLGGWPGAIVARRYLRHKTRKNRFLIAFWAIVVLHVMLVATVAHKLLGLFTRTSGGLD